jgi:hypothetical protein
MGRTYLARTENQVEASRISTGSEAATTHREFGPKVTSGSMRAFITPEEVETCLNGMRHERELTLLIEAFFHEPIRVVSPSDALHVARPLDRLYLCDEPVDGFDLSGHNLDYLPYRRGWLYLNMPLDDRSVLRLTSLDYKSAVVSAPEFFGWAKRRFMRSLKRGVDVEHVDYPGSRRPLNWVCYSADAPYSQGMIWTWHTTERYHPRR